MSNPKWVTTKYTTQWVTNRSLLWVTLYNLLEKIMDGKVFATKCNTKKMRFKLPNVIIVFSNMYPDTREFSEDRWLIFKINTKMMLEEVTTEKIKKKEEVKAAQKSYMDWRKKTVYDRIIKY